MRHRCIEFHCLLSQSEHEKERWAGEKDDFGEIIPSQTLFLGISQE